MYVSFIIKETKRNSLGKWQNLKMFSVENSLNHNKLVQIVAQSLVTHMKNTLILEELKWFNLVNGSGNLPSLLQVTCLSTETHLKLSRFRWV